MLSLRDVSKSFAGPRGRRVLDAISLDVAAGEYVAIMGESGAGKSTLLNIIAGLEVPDSGSVVFDGMDFTALDDDARTLARRSRIGFVFQAFHLLPHLTVAQNVALPLALNGAAPREAAEDVRLALEAVALETKLNSYPRELSGGETQRVAIARALVHRPRLLLADEPTGNLDAETAAHTLEVLRRQVKASGGAGILVTHSATAAATADRVLVLSPAGLAPQARQP